MTETQDWATVTAISDGTHFSGTSEIGTVLDLVGDKLDIGPAVTTPIVDGEVWFEAEAELTTTVPAWISIDAAQAPDTGNYAYWQIKRVQVIADDGATFDMPFRAVNYIADLDVTFQAALPRYARTVSDVHLADIIADHGGPLTVRCRWHLVPAYDTSTAGAGLVCDFHGLAVRSVELPDVDADVTLDGPEWAPALIVEDTSDTTGPSTPRALHVTITDPDGVALVEDVAVWDAGGLGWQYDGVLEPGIEWSLGWDVEFDDFATLRRELAGSTTCEPAVRSASAIIVTAGDYAATVDYPHSDSRIERSDGFDGWVFAAEGAPVAGAVYAEEDFTATTSGDLTDNNLTVDESGNGWAAITGTWNYEGDGSGVQVGTGTGRVAAVETSGREDVDVTAQIVIARGAAAASWQGILVRSATGTYTDGLRVEFYDEAATPAVRVLNGSTVTLATWELAGLMDTPPVDGDRVRFVVRCDGNDITLMSVAVNGGTPEFVDQTLTLTGADAAAYGAGSGADWYGLKSNENAASTGERFEFFQVAAIPPPVVDYPPLNTTTTYRAWHGIPGTPTPGVFDVDSDLSGIAVSQELTIAAAGWVLTDADTDTHLLVPVSAVAEQRESTTVANVGATAASVTRGYVTTPTYTATVTVVNTTDRRNLYQMLAAERLLLRGPHGQRDWVAVVGRISESNTTARTSPSPSTGPGAAAPTAYMATVQFTLAVDTSQP